MTDSANHDREFWRLVDDSFNDLLSDTELHELETKLSGDVDLQRHYIRLCRMHADLRLVAGARRALGRTRLVLEADSASSPLAGAPVGPPPLSAGSLWALLIDRDTWTNRFVWVGALAIAVSFYGVFGLLVWSMSKPPLREAAHAPAEGDIASSPVARINESADCNWEPGHSPHDKSRSDAVHTHEARSESPRQFYLAHGLAEIVLAQGARVTLTGPAAFDVLSANSGYLHRGKLVAFAPPQAIGFMVETQLATIVDRGTEFGVEVDDQGVAEVHVLQGKVDVAATGKSGSLSTPVRVSRNEAVRVGAEKSVTPIEFNRKNFVAAVSRPTPSPVDSPQKLPGLRLWLRADRGLKLDAAGNVEQWADQSDNGFDAVQTEPARRPRWMQSTDLLSTAGIRFDGVDDDLACLHGLDLDNAGDGTFFFLIGQIDRFGANAGIFSLRSRDSADWNSPDGFALACSQLGIKGLAAAAAALSPVPGSDPLQMDATLTDAGPYVVTVTKKGGLGTFRIDGFPKATDRYSIPSADKQSSVNTAGYLIGARADNGQFRPGSSLYGACDVAEILICDRALPVEETAAIEAYLLNRALNRPATAK